MFVRRRHPDLAGLEHRIDGAGVTASLPPRGSAGSADSVCNQSPGLQPLSIAWREGFRHECSAALGVFFQ